MRKASSVKLIGSAWIVQCGGDALYALNAFEAVWHHMFNGYGFVLFDMLHIVDNENVLVAVCFCGC